MNVLVTGASGLIASQIVTDLLIEGHHVTCCVRNTPYTKNLFPTANVISCDFINDTNSNVWLPRLKNIDVVINAVGIFYHPSKKIVWKIHYETPCALFNACVIAKVKKVIQISALGVDKVNLDYAVSKLAADKYLLNLPIASIILRPSMVYGRSAYGGSAFFRALASLAFILPVPGKGQQRLQPIYLNDLSKAITNLVNKPFQKKIILAAVGPKTISLHKMLVTLRSWLGFPKAYLIPIPLLFIRIGGWVGNFFPNSVMNSSAFKMLQRDNVATSAETNLFEKMIGFKPLTFKEGVYQTTSSQQDRWHAHLFLLRPLLKFSIAVMWFMSAICSLLPLSQTASYSLLSQIGLPSYLFATIIYSASIWNLFLAIAMLSKRYSNSIYLLQILTILIYTSIITFTLPWLWLEPFGPVVKNIPILVAIFILMALDSNK